MERPQHIPAGAIFYEEDGNWKLGDKNADGQKIGLWTTWHPEGYRWITVEYGNGTPPYHVQRFHPDGTLGEEADWYGGSKFLGVSRHIKSDNPTNEPFPAGGADKAPNVWMAEFDYIEEGIYESQRYFDRNNNPVSSDGDPVPERPANVPLRAHFVSNMHSATAWVMGQVDIRIGAYIGEYFEWDLNGKPVITRIYDTTGKALEEHQYNNGLLSRSKVYNNQGLVSTYYHRNVDPPLMQSQTIYKNNDKERTYRYYDDKGKLLYSIRDEKLSDTHRRRYYNDKLVCEGIRTGEVGDAVMESKYYLEDGTLVIDFTSLGEGTGVWNRYDTRGQLVQQIHVSNHDDDYRLKHLDTFMPSLGDYDNERTQTDWDAILEKFEERYQRQLVERKLKSLPVPPALRAELDKVDWKEIDTAFGDGANLPSVINGMLSEDEAVVELSQGKIWMEIEHQNSVYESTYKVTEILAKMAPLYTHSQVIQLRLIQHIYEVLGLYYITDDQELYNEMLNAIAAVIPQLMQLANGDDAGQARKATYILVFTGKEDVEQYLVREWHNTAKSSSGRGYALYSLCYYYLLKRQSDKLIATLSAAFDGETNIFLRFIMSAYLVALTKDKAQDNWLTELLLRLADHQSIYHDFGDMVPYTRDGDVQRYIWEILSKAKPEVLEQNIGPVIDKLPTVDILSRITYFRVIFDVLFPEPAALQEITPARRKALLVAADEVIKDPGFLNRKEVFDEFGIPHDAYALKQLAG